ncbi:MAG: aldo/keto reductase [Rhodobiaceae bacterium]|nr:aldo/keto reductase [Rhodobiaceae bacterium]
MKLALGTVQFGLPYGAFNRDGQVPLPEVAQILCLAEAAGIRILDTAHAYGESESVLGTLDAAGKFKIVTKIPSLEKMSDPAKSVGDFFVYSTRNLKCDKMHGLLLHSSDDLLGEDGDAVWSQLERLREKGLVTRIGISAYGPEEAKTLLERYPISLIQLPLNLFDRRHLDAGILQTCKEHGIEVHTRSAFLQGFALSDPTALPGHLAPWAPLLRKLVSRCGDLGISQIEAALGYSLSCSEVDHVVVGVDSEKQLAEILKASGRNLSLQGAFDDLASEDLDLIDPSRWR